MSEWRLMNTRSESITLTNLCATNGFDRDPNELYIYRLNHSSEYSGNTISKENWVRINVANGATSTWNATNNSWDNGTTTESLDPLPPHTAYWIKGNTDEATGGGATGGGDDGTGDDGTGDGETGDGATGGDDGTGGGDGTTPIEITSAMANDTINIVSNKTYVVNDTITYTGAITIEDGGTLNIDGGGILNITNADTIINTAGTINNFGTINSVDGGIDGTISGEVNIVIFLTDSIEQINDGDTYIVNDDVTVTNLNISSGGTLTISAGKKLKVNAVLDNSGDIINNGIIENNAINNANGTIENNGTINTSVDVNGTITGNGTVIIGTFNSINGNFIPPFVVTVNGSMKFAIDGAQQPTIQLISGQTYNFDVSEASHDGHPFRFSTTSNGTHGGGEEYTINVNQTGNIITFTAPAESQTLYYYCAAHSGMGGSITISST